VNAQNDLPNRPGLDELELAPGVLGLAGDRRPGQDHPRRFFADLVEVLRPGGLGRLEPGRLVDDDEVPLVAMIALGQRA
jgi:hypothetical protein